MITSMALLLINQSFIQRLDEVESKNVELIDKVFELEEQNSEYFEYIMELETDNSILGSCCANNGNLSE
jgi:hypothetical protein